MTVEVTIPAPTPEIVAELAAERAREKHRAARIGRVFVTLLGGTMGNHKESFEAEDLFVLACDTVDFLDKKGCADGL